MQSQKLTSTISIFERLAKRYPVVPATEHDASQLLEVFNEVWAKNQRLRNIYQQLFHRRYLENPYSRGFSSINTARDGDRIFGFTGSFDFEIGYHGQLLPATCTIDQAILPDYQTKGIGFFLLKGHYERDVIAVTGDLNYNAQRMHNTMKVREISNCSIVRRWVHPMDMFRPMRANGYNIKASFSIDDRFDNLWSTALKLYEIIGVRDRAILKWRYENLPTRDFRIYTLCRGQELKGYVVTTFDRYKWLARKGILVDFLFGKLQPDMIAFFLLAVLCDLAKRGAICVDALVTHHKLIEIFRSLGFYTTKANPQLRVYDNVLSRDKPDLWDGGKWHLTFGDSDFYFTR